MVENTEECQNLLEKHDSLVLKLEKSKVNKYNYYIRAQKKYFTVPKVKIKKDLIKYWK